MKKIFVSMSVLVGLGLAAPSYTKNRLVQQNANNLAQVNTEAATEAEFAAIDCGAGDCKLPVVNIGQVGQIGQGGQVNLPDLDCNFIQLPGLTGSL